MATFTVTNTNDSGAGSLRQAVLDANAAGGADDIVFAAGLAGGTIGLTGGQLALTGDVVIDGDVDGDDKADVTISGNNASRIFSITGAGTDVDLNSLTLTNGNAGVGNSGGAILAVSTGTLDISNTTIEDSHAGNNGGAIASQSAAVTLSGSLLSGNTAGSFGGGIYAKYGSATLTNSTVDGNSANNNGGGIAAVSTAVTLLNSTVTANRADADGGLTSYGGGIVEIGSTVTASNSAIADNFSGNGADERDVFGTIATATKSVFGTAVTITTNNGSTTNVADVGLGALQDNGDAVATRNLLENSVLRDAGDNASAAALTTDANGDDRTVAGTVDVGATEFQLVVTTAADVVNAADGVLSLREAVALANANAGADTITFAASLAGQTLTLTGGQLTVTSDIAIDGDVNGDNKVGIAISGNNASRIFKIEAAGTDVDLLSLTLANGQVDASKGAGIYAVFGTTLDILDTTIRDCRATAPYVGDGAYGGGIYSSGTLTVTNSTIAGNYAWRGGGVYVTGNATLVNSTIHGNNTVLGTVGHGGGIANLGDLVILNSTITGNTGYFGGGIRLQNGATATVTNSVVAQNNGGYLYQNIAETGAASTLIARNSFFGTTAGIDTDNGGNINSGGNPLLGQILDNGGTVLTRSPLDGSVLIGAGSNAALPADVHDIDGDGDTAEALPLDGRGGLRLAGGTVDMGAVEQIADETIGGTAGADTITGGDGADLLDGGSGNDNLTGGIGDDTYVVSAAGDVLTELSGQGSDTVQVGFTCTLAANFERLKLTTVNAIDGTGNSGGNFIDGNSAANTLTGLGGADRLDGKGGADTMIGGTGNEIYYIDNAGDTIVETGGAGGIDLVRSTLAINLTAIANVENAQIVSAANVNIAGSGGANALTGGDGANQINGGGGDTIRGGNGADRLIGAAGADTFVYLGQNETGPSANDIVTDFLSGTDTIDLSAVDADLTTGGDQAFALDLDASFSAGEIRLTVQGANLLFEANTDADAAAEMEILFQGIGSLAAGDFVL